MIQIWIANGSTQKTVASTYKDKQPQVVTLSSQVSPVFLTRSPARRSARAVAGLHLGRQDLRPERQHQPRHRQQGHRPDPLRPRRQAASTSRDGTSKAAPSWAPKVVDDRGCRHRPGLQGHAEARRQAQGRSSTDRHRRRRSRRARRSSSTTSARSTAARSRSTRATASDRRRSRSASAGSSRAGTRRSSAPRSAARSIAIPPADGYGTKGQPTAGIKGTDTLYFVVDVLGAA